MGKEELGFLFGLNFSPKDLIIIQKLVTARGSSCYVELSDRGAREIWRFKNTYYEYEIIPYHTHPISKPSSGDLETFAMHAMFGYKYGGLGTPDAFYIFMFLPEKMETGEDETKINIFIMSSGLTILSRLKIITYVKLGKFLGGDLQNSKFQTFKRLSKASKILIFKQ